MPGPRAVNALPDGTGTTDTKKARIPVNGDAGLRGRSCGAAFSAGRS